MIDAVNRYCPAIITEEIILFPSKGELLSERHFKLITKLMQKVRLLPAEIDYTLQTQNHEPMSATEFDVRSEHVSFISNKSFSLDLFEVTLEELTKQPALQAV